MPRAPLPLILSLVFGCTPAGGDASDGASTGAPASGSTGGVATTADVTTTTTVSSSGEPDSTTGGPTTDATTGSTGPDPTGSSTGDPPAEPAIHHVGRFDASDPGHVRMGWSGAGVVFRFDGTGASVTLDDAGRYFTVVVDGAVQPTLATTPGEQTYPLAAGLPAGEHTIELYRRTEGSFGPTVLLGVDIDGELLPPPPVTRRIEIVGDSITAGYGVEGTDPCNFSAETENHYITYGALAARALGAEIHAVAWSGKGIVYNYADDKQDPLPALYDRTVAVEPAAWDFSWQPDVVVINLGTNDFSTGDDPPEELYVGEYALFLAHLRAVYPDAYQLVLAPSLWGDEVALVAGYLQDVVDQRHAAGDPDVGFADINVPWIGSGCDGHPSAATHEGMAMRLTEELQTRLGW
jgi:lysophospholipase L1-like esterase